MEGDAQQTEEERVCPCRQVYTAVENTSPCFIQQQAEEVREEAMSRAREKREFRQKNLDAASTYVQ